LVLGVRRWEAALQQSSACRRSNVMSFGAGRDVLQPGRTLASSLLTLERSAVRGAKQNSAPSAQFALHEIAPPLTGRAMRMRV